MASSARNRLQTYLDLVESPHDLLVAALHSSFVESGFSCVGTDPIHPTAPFETLPDQYKTASGVYSLVYKVDDILAPLITRFISANDELIIHCSLLLSPEILEQYPRLNEVPSLTNQIVVSKFIDSSSGLSDQASKDSFPIGDLIDLTNSIHRHFEESMYKVSPSRRHQQPKQQSTQQPRLLAGPFPLQEYGSRNTSVGTQDRYPSTVGGFPSQQGGSSVGPLHPIFGHPRVDPSAGTGLPRGAIPPGARFDPFGPPPPHLPRSPHGPFRGEPDKDEFKPPGTRDYQFM
ncbi:hypothetical protein GEMRC1_002273 [Eukaryota sp. GEM-RC1]